ncbi:SDR family oxidoreductase [Methylobacterium brachythecii]|uniref:NAD(P)H-binding protein n=1 Tax=Methylobacterium brachythecii TaxID=1176177 RepID=A0A7W6APZ9_9HYPH|nr:SDR family oxidoreductase [Methylobacterium brachythecii]MBB3905294.1 nucleoside-diphosphate-sugar epimerase [Methylobacterium brachythecii]GLS45932.1 NAD(P)H-binding protein [Methylobacterium brachythecii]
MARILLTGATGLIGGAVLHHALDRGDDTQWVCLVRCGSVEQGRQRVASRLERFTDPFTAQRLARKVEIVPGDFTRADLDMDPRLDDCTHVLHLAADTSWFGDERVYRTNHDGTLALARRARSMPGLVRFLHVGTAMICGSNAPNVVEERAYPAADANHIVAYTISKAATETSLAELFPDLPVVIARPSIVVGHSTLGAAPSSSILWVVRAADRLRMLPCAPESAVDIVPADWVAETLVGLLTKSELAHNLYHVSAGTGGRTRWADVIDAFEAAEPTDGMRAFTQFDLQRDRSTLRKRFAEVFGLDGALKQVMLRATRAYYVFCALDLAFSNQRLLDEGFAPPPSLPSYLPVCLANSAGIVEQFADDMEMFSVAATPAPVDPMPLAATA